MSLGILRHAGRFTQVNVGWKLQEIGLGIKIKFRHGLSLSKERNVQRRNKHNDAYQQAALHVILPKTSILNFMLGLLVRASYPVPLSQTTEFPTLEQRNWGLFLHWRTL